MEVKIAFYKAFQPKATKIDKIIAKYTRGQYSHTELIIDGYMYSTSPRDGRVRVKKHRFDESRWDYINIDNLDIIKIENFFNKTKNKPYDWLGIFGFVLPLKDSEKSWFCSEWVSQALIIGGCKKLFDKKPSQISPNRLYKILKGE